MPELPDILLYLSALETRIVGQTLERVRIASPFLLRSVDPPVQALEGQSHPPPRTHRQAHRLEFRR